MVSQGDMSMWLEIARSSPGIFGVVAIAWLFIKSSEKRDIAIREIHQEATEARKKMVEVVEKMASAIERNTRAFDHFVRNSQNCEAVRDYLKHQIEENAEGT